MIEFSPITLDAQKIFGQYMMRDNIALSDMNFTNCFMWRHAREIHYAVLQDTLIIQTCYQGSEPFVFFPIGAYSISHALRVLEVLKTHYRALGFGLHLASLSKQQASAIDSHFGVQSVAVREKFDYIYDVAELITLNGRKYHKKKNHLNAFLQEYGNFVFEEISAHNIPAILEAYEKWFEANPNKSDGLQFEYLGIQDALNLYENLGLQGGVIFIDGKVGAFSFGEVLACNLAYEQSDLAQTLSGESYINKSGKVAVMHIEKADSQYRGIYQAINQQVLQHCFSDCVWVNREEDLGIEGLRKAKQSYQPAFLLEKFKVSIQG